MFKIAVYALGIFALFFIYVKYIEYNGVFFPSKRIEATPNLINLAFEDIGLITPDKIKINAWFIPHSSAKFTLLFFHGNAGNLSHRLDKIAMLQSLGLNILIIDYRGYGKSQGKPYEKGIYADAETAYTYLTAERKINPEDIILYGESLGGAVAIDLAAKVKTAGVITEVTFTSARDMAKKIFPIVPGFFIADRFNSLDKVKRVTVPKLFIASRDDEIIPPAMALKLYQAAAAPKEFTEINGRHNDAFLDSKEKYLAAIKSFLESLKNGR